MAITLKDPFFISSRLLPAVKVGNTTISIEYTGREPQGRTQYRYYIDFADGSEHVGEDLMSGVGGGSLKEGMDSLLSFLVACSESRRPGPYAPGENADLFPDRVGEWAEQNDSEITSVQIWIEEAGDCCIEAC